MMKAFCFALAQWSHCLIWQLTHLFSGGPKAWLRNIILLFIVTPFLLTLQLVHWLFFLLDEIFFPQYKSISINNPIFILGIPRSGTTFLHRTLSEDRKFTSTTLWDCVIAPSITEKVIYTAIGKIFSPIIKRIPIPQFSFFRKMESIHLLGLSEPEEDFLLLLPIFSCFILLVVFPEYTKIWDLAFFDKNKNQKDKTVVMTFYQRMLKKHLYFYGKTYQEKHGKEIRYLAKNPSFTPMLESLTEHFDNAVFIGCIREPQRTIPSQISSLQPALKLFGFSQTSHEFKNNIVNMLVYYYNHLRTIKKQGQHTLLLISMEQLNKQLTEILEVIYQTLAETIDNDLRNKYTHISEESKAYNSKHKYSKDIGNIDLDQLKRHFDSLWPFPDGMLVTIENGKPT
ncbi:sulfotransferase [Teredinibacter sp. KSP-S5-2]|uniref:sulfotransferase n=1 Tax=Teredinibacter sp. KSP-S5-2 TaxID=3034506 RepID=UPI0029342856|nr:sulfotransferase [Teredinibacter sp. KSP-S5-2]WNO10673.1 sulfotransferase [Teredinibacter sp. KSP-S5-2]